MGVVYMSRELFRKSWSLCPTPEQDSGTVLFIVTRSRGKAPGYVTTVNSLLTDTPNNGHCYMYQLISPYYV